MSPSSVDENTPYFFSQRRERQFQRRLRKIPDDVSVFREKRDGLGADAESVVSAGWLSRTGDVHTTAKSAIRRGSVASVSGKRVTLSGKVVFLPPVDKDGPKLVSGESESDEGTHKPLASVREEEAAGARSGLAKEIYKFNELKFGSTSILSNLGKCLDSVQLREHVAQFSDKLDPELVRKFLQDHRSLTSDVAVEKREWQTDCYLDLSIGGRNKHAFFTARPGEEERGEQGEGSSEDRRRSEGATIAAISQRYAQRLSPKLNLPDLRSSRKKETGGEKRSPKRVTLNQEIMSRGDTPHRPQTAHSVLSNFSYHSDSRPSSAGESRANDNQFDALPPELRPPSIMLYKRESVVPAVRVKGPRTRLEKYRDQTTTRRRQPSRVKIRGECAMHYT
jgi:hypothetical protein